MFSHRFVLVILLAVSSAQADTIYVDDDNCPDPGSGTVGDPYCSIQTAIDNAVDTDEVVVAPGTYFETINFLGKAIWLHSSDGVEVTTIDGTGNFHVVRCVSGEGPNTLLDGFTITGGSGMFHPVWIVAGGGMYNIDSSPTVAAPVRIRWLIDIAAPPTWSSQPQLASRISRSLVDTEQL